MTLRRTPEHDWDRLVPPRLPAWGTPCGLSDGACLRVTCGNGAERTGSENLHESLFHPCGAEYSHHDLRASSRAQHIRIEHDCYFSITGEGLVGNEVTDIAYAAAEAAKRVPNLRLVTLGRGSCESESLLRKALLGSGVELRPWGFFPPGRFQRCCQLPMYLFLCAVESRPNAGAPLPALPAHSLWWPMLTLTFHSH